MDHIHVNPQEVPILALVVGALVTAPAPALNSHKGLNISLADVTLSLHNQFGYGVIRSCYTTVDP